MTHRQKQHLTISGIVASATIVVSALGVLANGVLDLDKKSEISATTTAANMRTIALMAEEIDSLQGDVARLQRKLKMKPTKHVPVKVEVQEQPGLVRRIFKMLF